MDQVFKALPLVLQWEILAEYVGGYSVRNNRLRRFMTGKLQIEIMKQNFILHDSSSRNLWAKNIVYSSIPSILQPLVDTSRQARFADGEYPEIYEAVALFEFSLRGKFVVLFKKKDSDELSYGYYNKWSNKSNKWEFTTVDDSIVLPPFEKHSYPSYPYTNKKLGRPVLKMKVYDSAGKPAIMSSLKYRKYCDWRKGRPWWYDPQYDDEMND